MYKYSANMYTLLSSSRHIRIQISYTAKSFCRMIAALRLVELAIIFLTFQNMDDCLGLRNLGSHRHDVIID
mgnify:CR=1 FL=1